MADGTITVGTVNANDGATITADIPSPISDSYVGTVNSNVAVITVPEADLVDATNANVSLTLTDGANTDTDSIVIDISAPAAFLVFDAPASEASFEARDLVGGDPTDASGAIVTDMSGDGEYRIRMLWQDTDGNYAGDSSLPVVPLTSNQGAITFAGRIAGTNYNLYSFNPTNPSSDTTVTFNWGRFEQAAATSSITASVTRNLIASVSSTSFPAIDGTYQRTDSSPPARPTSGNSVVDPFDTNITIKNMGSKFHFYATRASFSADSSRLLLERDVVDINSNTVLYTIPSADSNGEHAMSSVDSNVIWACAGNFLKKTNISTGVVTNVAQFTAYTSVTMGRFEGSPSADDRYIPIVGRDSSGTSVAAFVCDTTTGSIVNNNVLALGGSFDNCKITHDGNHLYVATSGAGIAIAPTSNVSAAVTSSVFPQHSDTAIEDGTGDNVLVNFTTGSTLTVLKTDGSSYDINLGFNTSNGHISGRCVTTPGWALISSYSTRQLVAVKIKQGTPEFRHYGFHRGADFADATRSFPTGYNSIAKSCVSPDFSRIVSHSEWNSSSARECYVHTYS